MTERLFVRIADALLAFVTPAERFASFDQPTPNVDRRTATPELSAAYSGPERRRPAV